MKQEQQELSQTYHVLADIEIASLYAQITMLSDVAQTALKAEAERRHLTGEHLSKLYASQLRREAKFDGREKIRRKSIVPYLLFRNDPKGTLAAVIITLILALLIFALNHH